MVSKTISLGGYKFSICGVSDDDPYFRNISSDMENEFQILCQKFVKSDYTSIDIGANIGIKSLFLSRHVKGGRVIEFEANPIVANVLEKNIRDNHADNVTIKECAIGENNGLSKFEGESAYGHLSSNGNSIDVSVLTLDTVLREIGVTNFDFIKIYVEGNEPQIIRGSMEIIDKNQALVMFEFNSWCLLAYGNNNPLDFLKYITQHFSHVYTINKNGTDSSLLDRIQRGDEIRVLYQNLVHDSLVTDILATNSTWRLTPSQKEYKISQEALEQKFDNRLAQTEQKINEFYAYTEALNKQLIDITNSRSWRMTKPLRLFGKFARWFVRGSIAWLKFSPSSRPRRTLRQLLIKAKEKLHNHKSAKNLILIFFKPFPKLKERLSRVGKTNPATVPINTDYQLFYPEELSPRAKKIYKKLESAIERWELMQLCAIVWSFEEGKEYE